ncbi:MAG: hypothetical protein AAGG01_23355, partial [Planctomycetota bacterium]
EPTLELRDAAIKGLGNARSHGKTFLQLIVESTAGDSIRETALEMHVRLGGEDDFEFYDRVYKKTLRSVQKMISEESQKKNRTKREREGIPAPEVIWPTGKLRSTALNAIIDQLLDEDLEKAFEEDRSLSVRQLILEELARRESDKAATFSETLVNRVDYPARARLQSARILLDLEGPKVAKGLIDIGVKVATPAVLSRGLADMLADLKDEDVDKRLAKLVGKGRAPQKVFAILATRNVSGDKFLKKLRKGLADKETEVVVETVRSLGRRRDRGSIEDLEKTLEKVQKKGADESILESLMETLSILYDGQNEWMERLETFAAHEEAYLRNAAIAEIARIGRASSVDLLLDALKHPVWSTRLVGLKALVARREANLIPPIVEQMQTEVGRMQLEFGDALFQLTGQPFGRRATVWARWLKDQGGSVEVMDKAQVQKLSEAEAERRLKEVSQVEKEARFFGIQIVSERVLFILDISGSMAEPLRLERVGETPPTRMDVAKRELKTAIESLPSNALFNVVPFSGSAMSWMEGGLAASATESAKLEALLYVSRLDALGGTNLYDALAFAFDDPDVDTIYLLSDGEPSIGDLIDPQ